MEHLTHTLSSPTKEKAPSSEGRRSSTSVYIAPQLIPTLGSSLTPAQYRSRKVALITGITGQDGSYLTELLLEKGYEVHGL